MGAYEEDTLGAALAGQLTVFSLIGHLKAKGILSKAETIAIYEHTLTALESYPRDDPAVRVARKLLDQMAQIAAKAPKGVQER
jgi:hypothetical protein